MDEDKTAVITKKIGEKSIVKQQVYRNTVEVFKQFKSQAEQLINELKGADNFEDHGVSIDFTERGEYVFEFKIGGDVIVGTMHSNIFEFPRDHAVMKSSYVQEDPLRSYCGTIYFYNFLSDSFKYQRVHDLGYLVGRVFVNKENHYFVEGKRQIGFLFNDFIHDIIDPKAVKSILESAILYCLDFDLLTPPYEAVKEISVEQMMAVTSMLKIKTGKRLGFKFHSDQDEAEIEKKSKEKKKQKPAAKAKSKAK